MKRGTDPFGGAAGEKGHRPGGISEKRREPRGMRRGPTGAGGGRGCLGAGRVFPTPGGSRSRPGAAGLSAAAERGGGSPAGCPLGDARCCLQVRPKLQCFLHGSVFCPRWEKCIR